MVAKSKPPSQPKIAVPVTHKPAATDLAAPEKKPPPKKKGGKIVAPVVKERKQKPPIDYVELMQQQIIAEMKK